MVSKHKLERDFSIQAVSNKLLEHNISMDDIVLVKTDESFTEALERINPDKNDMHIGSDKVEYAAIYNYCRYMDTPPDERNIPLAKRIPLQYIEDYLAKEGKSWRKLKYDEKLDMLFDLGLAVKQSDENMDIATKYYVNMENYRGQDRKVHMGLVIVSSERIDKAWLNSGYASEDAILYTKDGSLAAELSKLSRR